MINSENLKQGAKNILTNCANLSNNESLLIISEDPALGWYKKDITEALSKEANDMGVKTTVLEVDGPQNDSKNKLIQLIEDFDCTVFFARIGDQDRFDTTSFKTKRVMSYARSAENLSSIFGCINHQALVDIKKAINKIFSNGGFVEITCPLGTKVFGRLEQSIIDDSSDVGVLRFPMLVPTPVKARNFSGRVALSKYLTPTGSKVYEPASLFLEDQIYIIIENGKIIDFEGDENIIIKVKNHYNHISEIFNIDKNHIDSWHAGIHPGTSYNHPIEDDPDRWSNTMFGSPKYIHFHTCGNYAPGEISWMIENHNITVDGKPLWDKGRLMVNNFDETRICLDKWNDLIELYENQ